MEPEVDAPPVTAVVVNYDGGDLTLRSLASLRAQNYPALRVVLVDNGSRDGVAGRVRADWPDVAVVEAGANLGFAGGVNLGVRHADPGAHVALLNPDATAEPGWLAALVRALDAEPSIGAVNAKVLFEGRFVDVELESAVELRGARQGGVDVWGRLQFVSGWEAPAFDGGEPIRWCHGQARLRVPEGEPVELLVSADGGPARWESARAAGPPQDVVNSAGVELMADGFGVDRGYLQPDGDKFTEPADVLAWTGSSVLLRRAYLDEIGPLDEKLFLYYEDLDHAWRGTKAGWRYRYEPKAVARHVHQASTGGSTRTEMLIQRNRLIVLSRHGSRRAALRAFGRHLLVTGSYARRDVVRGTRAGRRRSVTVVRQRLRAFGGALVRAPRELSRRR